MGSGGETRRAEAKASAEEKEAEARVTWRAGVDDEVWEHEPQLELERLRRARAVSGRGREPVEEMCGGG